MTLGLITALQTSYYLDKHVLLPGCHCRRHGEAAMQLAKSGGRQEDGICGSAGGLSIMGAIISEACQPSLPHTHILRGGQGCAMIIDREAAVEQIVKNTKNQIKTVFLNLLMLKIGADQNGLMALERRRIACWT